MHLNHFSETFKSLLTKPRILEKSSSTKWFSFFRNRISLSDSPVQTKSATTQRRIEQNFSFTLKAVARQLSSNANKLLSASLIILHERHWNEKGLSPIRIGRIGTSAPMTWNASLKKQETHLVNQERCTDWSVSPLKVPLVKTRNISSNGRI